MSAPKVLAGIEMHGSQQGKHTGGVSWMDTLQRQKRRCAPRPYYSQTYFSMKYPNPHLHDFISSAGHFCDECGFPSADHRAPSFEVVGDYWAKTRPPTMGRIVKRKKDGLYFFEIREWNKREWHPLTVGEQSGRFSDAQDRFASWKLITQRWEFSTPQERGRL